MPAACSLSSRLSTRNASITMSWVADAVATSSAPSATSPGADAGSVRPRNTIATISSTCENTSQPRRRPSKRDSTGTSSASTSGAQMNFAVYGVPTSANSPMVPRLTPASRIQTSKVAPDSASGRPAEKPRNSTIRTRGLR